METTIIKSQSGKKMKKKMGRKEGRKNNRDEVGGEWEFNHPLFY